MNLKKILQTGLLVLTLNTCQGALAMEAEKESFAAKPSSLPQRVPVVEKKPTSLEDLPPEIIERIALTEPSTLPRLMFLNKDAYEKVYSLVEAATYFCKPYCTFNDWFRADHGYKQKDKEGKEYSSNYQAFKVGFAKLVFNLGTESREKEVITPSYKIIRSYLSDHTRMPGTLVQDFPELFPQEIPASNIRFNYLELMVLNRQQSFLDSDILESVYKNLKSLKDAYEKDTIKESKMFERYCLDPLDSSNIFPFYTMLERKKISNGRIHNLLNKIFKLYKLIAIEKNKHEQFYKGLGAYREAAQQIPVNLSTLSQEIPDLFGQCEAEVKDLAKKRWQIVNQIQNMLKVG